MQYLLKGSFHVPMSNNRDPKTCESDMFRTYRGKRICSLCGGPELDHLVREDRDDGTKGRAAWYPITPPRVADKDGIYPDGSDITSCCVIDEATGESMGLLTYYKLKNS